MGRALLILVVLLPLACRPPVRTLTVAAALLPSELPAYREMLRGFERASGWKVVVVPQQYADIRRALKAQAHAGAGTLDLVELDVYSLAVAANDVEVLDEVALAAAIAALAPPTLHAGRIDGLRFLPHRLSWQALLYNHAELGAPPRTWDELRAVAHAHPGRIAFKGALYEGLTCDVLPFVWAAGGRADVFDDAAARAAFRLFADLAPALHPQSAVLREATAAEALARGEVVLELNWPFAMSLFHAQGLAPEPIRSAPLPRGPAGGATVLGGGYIGIPRGASQPAAAQRLIAYLLAAPAQTQLRDALGWFSARRDIAVADGGAGAALLAGFAATRDEVRARPQRLDYPLLSRLWQEAFRAVVFSGSDPDTALAAAARQWAAAAPPAER